MSLPVNALIALKALQIGSAAAASPSKEVALRMLEQAISWLGASTEEEALARRAFYVAARAEMMRALGDPTSDRDALKSIGKGANGSVYYWYMRLEEATESRTGMRWQGSASPYAAGGGTSQDQDNPYLSSQGRMYRAMKAIGLEEKLLSDSDRRFLERTTLYDLLEKHGIPFAA